MWSALPALLCLLKVPLRSKDGHMMPPETRRAVGGRRSGRSASRENRALEARNKLVTDMADMANIALML
jgi:hypothetical protein